MFVDISCGENKNTLLYSIFLSENCAVYKKMWKNMI